MGVPTHVRGFFFVKGEPKECGNPHCRALFCEIPGRQGRARKSCSAACNDYLKGPGRPVKGDKRFSVPVPTGRIIPRDYEGPGARNETRLPPEVEEFFSVLDGGGAQVSVNDRTFPSWDRKAELPDHPAFSEWVLDPGPWEGQTARHIGPVLGSGRPWNALT
jgi:hypothetical protein